MLKSILLNQISGPLEVHAYCDKPEDFKEGEVVTGQFVRFYEVKHDHVWYALVDLDDGRKTRVALKYFSSIGDAVCHLVKGDRLKLIRQQYSTKQQHSSWKVLEYPIRVLSQLEDDEKSLLLKLKILILFRPATEVRVFGF